MNVNSNLKTEQPESETQNSTSAKVSNEKKCIYCDAIIPIHAHVCYKCNRDQRWYLNYFRIGDLLLLISLLISFGMVYFSYKNFHESREEHIKASQALVRASAAEEKVTKGTQQLKVDIENRSEDVRRVESHVREVVTDITKAKNELLDIKKSVKLESARVARVEKNQEQATLVKIIKHEQSSNLKEDTLRGQVHQVIGPYTLTLPPAKVGLSGTFAAGAAAVFSVKARDNDRIILHGVPLAIGNKIASIGNIEAKVSLVCLKNNEWETLGVTAIFIDGGR